MRNGVEGIRLAAVILAFCLAPAAAMAYIDPGNGAYMVQALFTLVGAALFYLRHPVRTFKAAWHWAFGGRNSELGLEATDLAFQPGSVEETKPASDGGTT